MSSLLRLPRGFTLLGLLLGAIGATAACDSTVTVAGADGGSGGQPGTTGHNGPSVTTTQASTSTGIGGNCSVGTSGSVGVVCIGPYGSSVASSGTGAFETTSSTGFGSASSGFGGAGGWGAVGSSSTGFGGAGGFGSSSSFTVGVSGSAVSTGSWFTTSSTGNGGVGGFDAVASSSTGFGSSVVSSSSGWSSSTGFMIGSSGSGFEPGSCPLPQDAYGQILAVDPYVAYVISSIPTSDGDCCYQVGHDLCH